MFNIQGRTIKVKSVRTIKANSDGTSTSYIRSEVRNDEFNDETTAKALSYIIERHKKENALLQLVENSELALTTNFSLPFDHVFYEVQNSIVQLNQLLAQESAIDPSIAMACGELQELHRDLKQASEKIMRALQARDELQQEIKRQSGEVAAAASQIEKILTDPDKSPTVPSTKNDVAFMFSLVPLIAAVVGYVMKKSK